MKTLTIHTGDEDITVPWTEELSNAPQGSMIIIDKDGNARVGKDEIYGLVDQKYQMSRKVSIFIAAIISSIVTQILTHILS